VCDRASTLTNYACEEKLRLLGEPMRGPSLRYFHSLAARREDLR
jgi:hypothetical protein